MGAGKSCDSFAPKGSLMNEIILPVDITSGVNGVR